MPHSPSFVEGASVARTGGVSSIPLVDLSALKDSTNPALNASKSLVDAFRISGFAYVKNHGIPEEIIKSAFQWVRLLERTFYSSLSLLIVP